LFIERRAIRHSVMTDGGYRARVSAVVARLRKKTEAAAIREPSTSRNNSGEAPMMAERLHSRGLLQHDRLLPDRRLRNRIIIGNAIVWVAIAVLILLLFF
jgi:hypothetical protein